MNDAQRTELAELLARRYRQPDRLVLLSRLGVDPEECTLGSQDPEEVAWRMVRWFEDRGRLEELARAARVGFLRRWLRRLTAVSGAGALAGLVLVFGADVFGMQARFCQLSWGQPGLSDACGAWSIGGAPTKAERLGWQSRERGSCAALRAHVAKFPRGAYRQTADARLTALQIETEETWTTREHPLELYVGRDVAPSLNRAGAEADARARAQTEADRLCKSFAATGQNRLRLARTVVVRMQCDAVKGGQICGLEGQAVCAIEVRGQLQHERCAEPNAP